MKLIIPMAGMGKRMRPHTLTLPKPLIPVAGKTIVQRLVEEISESSHEKIEAIGFITGHYGSATEKYLISVAENAGAEGIIYYQDEALGIAHAISCAGDLLSGKVMVAFADTLFKGDFTIDNNAEGIIWVQKVTDPKEFGVVKVNENKIITDFVEKPSAFISDLAIIGVYFFADGDLLKNKIKYVIENNIKDRGEFQLTTVLQCMKNHGVKFKAAEVNEWLDCGNKDATIYSNQRILEYEKGKKLVSSTSLCENSIIIPPCYIGENVRIFNSIIGPHVSVGDESHIEDSRVKNSIIRNNTTISCLNIQNSMLGSHVQLRSKKAELNLGDYTSQLHHS